MHAQLTARVNEEIVPTPGSKKNKLEKSIMTGIYNTIKIKNIISRKS